jgi:hypothetical protein
MRYWSLKETNRVIAVDILMSPRWLEISKDEFTLKRLEFPLTNKEVYP